MNLERSLARPYKLRILMLSIFSAEFQALFTARLLSNYRARY